MSLIEPTGAAAVARGSPHASTSVHAARSGPQKAQAIQSVVTATAAAPVESLRAITQPQAIAKSRMKIEMPTPEQLARKTPQSASKRPNPSLLKPMTAVLLHELRLQQELADVQEQVSEKRA
jgi:hypothetical protein